MSTDQSELRENTVDLLEYFGIKLECVLGKPCTAQTLREAWVVCRQLLDYADWSNRRKFPDVWPLTPDDNSSVRRLVLFRIDILNRLVRLANKRARKRRRRRRR